MSENSENSEKNRVLTKEEWAKWKETTENIIIDYQPKQLEEGYCYRLCGNLDCGHRSPYCSWLSYALGCCGHQLFKIDREGEGNAMLKLMLNHDDSKCPKELRGVWWMRDNVAPERIVTLSDMDWKTDSYGIKDMRLNWSHDPTCLGCCIACCVDRIRLKMEVEIEDDWIVIRYLDKIQWIKKIGEDTTITSNDIQSGDMLRLTYPDPFQPKDPSYQYVLKRLAYLNDGKELVLTKHWDEYKRRMSLSKGEHPFYLENDRQWVKLKT